MMGQDDRIWVSRRFQRSVRIDSDHADLDALSGYMCPQSSADVLLALGNHVAETGHGAFIWTGPYGSGKSSLVVAFSALLSGNAKLRKTAETAIGADTSRKLLRDLPPMAKGWRTLAVVGRGECPAQVIGESLEAAGVRRPSPRKPWNDADVVDALVKLSREDAAVHGGVLLFVDEMGKFLEQAVQEDADVYLFQLLAEAASRSDGRLIVIGVLHQAFEEYANRLSRQMRDEWAKIQGRFIDLTVNAAGEEQIELISRAIETDHEKGSPSKASTAVAREIQRTKSADAKSLAQMLEACWPLHPVSTCSLVAVARRRFGQNQRSIFGFLNSAESLAFQDFLQHRRDSELYTPSMLFDYLRVNLEASILSSPDGHRWSIAIEAIQRCEAVDGDAEPIETHHIELLQVIALIDLFKDRSGLVPTEALLKVCLPRISPAKVKAALDKLVELSVIIYRRHNDAYAIYAGSDFDIDQAVRDELQNARELDFAALQRSAGLQPVLAKRHYHQTGALRWLDLHVVPASVVIDRAESFKPREGTIGQFLLAVPVNDETARQAIEICQQAAAKSSGGCVVPGLSNRAWRIVDLAREINAIAEIQADHPELVGDSVAQRELENRLAVLQGQLEEELRRSVEDAKWCFASGKPVKLGFAELNDRASDLADRLYSAAPRFHSELLNRIRPSSNAVGARNALVKAMVLAEGEPRLGIDGFPAERGVFSSLLEETNLYREVGGRWEFRRPTPKSDTAGLSGLWKSTTEFVKQSKGGVISVDDIYRRWAEQPFGVKQGVMPVLAVAFILTMRDKLAVYREQVFQPRFGEIDAEFLARDAKDIQLRWVETTEMSNDLLKGVHEAVQSLCHDDRAIEPSPLEVARAMVSIFESLPAWTRRTSQLGETARRIRDTLKVADDPNKLLFEDLAAACAADGAKSRARNSANGNGSMSVPESVRDALEEMLGAYERMLGGIGRQMLAELQAKERTGSALAELRRRAENIRDIKSDFRLSAFIGRLAAFEGRVEDIEGIASLAANKPPRDWVDTDIDFATVEIASFAQRFIRLEHFARVKGRPDKRQSIAVVVGLNGRPEPVHAEFDVSDADHEQIEHVVERIQAVIGNGHGDDDKILLAAIAELSSQYASKVNAAAAEETGE